MNKQYITIKIGRTRLRRIPINDIIYCKADGSYTNIKTIDCDHLISKLLKDIEQDLVNDILVRVNRSYIVNINNCLELKVGKKPELILCNNDKIIPSTQYVDNLAKLFCMQN